MLPLYVYKKDFDHPLILAGKRAFVVLSRRGELSVAWHRWGSTTDYGGFYAPPQRVTGPLKIGIVEDGRLMPLRSKIVKGEYYPGYAEFYYESGRFTVEKTIFIPEKIAGAAIILKIRNKKNEKTVLPIMFMTESWLGFVDLDGILPDKTSVHVSDNLITMSAGSFHGVISSNFSFAKTSTGGDDLIPSEFKAYITSYKDRTKKILVSLDIPLEKNEEKTIVIALGASSEKRGEAIGEVKRILDDWSRLLEEKKAHFEKFLSSVTKIETPEKGLDLAFTSAVIALELLKAEQPGEILGVYAGYPWFAGFWGRDTGWILPALLAIGDLEWARMTIDGFLRNQARHDYDILGAVKGEIPMVHGHKTQFFYGAADSTLYYPILIHDYVFKTGDLKYAKRIWPNLVELINWGHRKDVDKDCLIENGPSKLDFFVDATWMDTEDRMEKAIEIQALWAKALESASVLAEFLGKTKESKDWLDEAVNVRRKISQVYWNDEEGYFYDTIRPNGKPEPKVRPNAMVALMYGYASNQQAQLALTRIEKDDMTTGWGVRTLSSKDPYYNPDVYHSGVVWPLVTGWTAFAEYANNRPDRSYKYLKSMVQRILDEGGMYAEAYNGDKAKPHISCILQAWSMSMFLWPIMECLFGIKTNAFKKELIVSPRFPKNWKWAKIENIRVGRAQINLHFDLDKKEVEAENMGEETVTVNVEGKAIELRAMEKTRRSLV